MIVADATTLAALALIGKADVLVKLVGKVKISDQTERELKEILGARGSGHPFPDEVVEVVTVDVSYATLSLSESETLQLGRQIKAKVLITDDAVLRREARKDRMVPLGTLGILYAARRKALIPNLEEVFTRLREVGYGIAPACERMLLTRTSSKGKRPDDTTIFDFRC